MDQRNQRVGQLRPQQPPPVLPKPSGSRAIAAGRAATVAVGRVMGRVADATRSAMSRDLTKLVEKDVAFKRSSLDCDFKETFEDTCKETINRLKKYNDTELFDDGLVSDETLHTLMELVNEKRVCISVFGRHNCGKSSFLNAIVGDSVLPVKSMNETSVKVYIEHDIRVHKGRCRGKPCELPEFCPTLLMVNSDGTKKKFKGVESIYNALTTLNEYIRSEKMDLPEYLRFKGNIDLLSGTQSGWTVCLVDNPGFGEAKQHITQIAEASINRSAAYIYLVESGGIGGEIEKQFFAELKSKDKAAFRDGRLVVAVTKFDEQYAKSNASYTREKPISREQMTESIYESIGVTRGHRLKRLEPLIVLSSNWALLAQECCHDQRWIRAASQALAMYPHISESVACGQGESLEEALKNVKVDDLAGLLYQASGLDSLKRRIYLMTSACIEIWAKKIKQTFTLCLDNAVADINSALMKCMESLTEHTCAYNQVKKEYDTLMEKRNEIEQTARQRTESEVWKSIAQQYPEDMKVSDLEKIGKDRVRDLMRRFKRKCYGRLSNPQDKFGPPQFREDIEAFLDEAAAELEATFNETFVFKGMHAKLMDHREIVVERCTLLRSDAKSVCQSARVGLKDDEDDESGCCITVSVVSESGFMNTNTEPDQSTTGPNLGSIKQKVAIAPVTLSGWEKFVAWICAIFKGSLEDSDANDYLHRSQLNDTFEQVESKILEECDEYLGNIKHSTIQYFYAEYCEKVLKRLEEFDIKYRVPLQQVNHKLQQAYKNRIVGGEENIKQLCKMRAHLQMLKEHVGLKYEEFNQAMSRPEELTESSV